MSIPDIVYKAHGTGNDFVVYADPEGIYEPSTEEVVRLTDRHRGIGGDGLLRITRPQFVSDLSEEDIRAAQADDASWFMDYRNADGSLAQMCGNGTRVTALFIRRMCMLTGKAQDDKPLRLATRAGVKILSSLGDDELLGQDVFRVDMGNPHVVCLIEDGSASYTEALESSQATLPALTTLDLSRKPVVSPVLDEGQNVEFVRIESVDPLTGQGRAFMRVHERGVGETLSCGTGLCATGVTLCALTGISHWTIHVLGGVLDVDVDDESVRLTGSATIVARIELNPQH
jgi:diaminopimelate epimerase